MAAEHRDRIRDFDGRVLVLKQPPRVGWQTIERGSLLKGKQLSQFVALPDEKMKDVENLIVVGWPLKKALLFKEKKLTRKHKIEDLLDAAAKAGMKLQVEIDRWAVKVWRVPKGEGI